MVAGIIIFQKPIPKKVNDDTSERIGEESAARVITDTVVVSQAPDKVKVNPYETLASKSMPGTSGIVAMADKTFSRNIKPALEEMERFRESGKDSTLNQNALFSQVPDLQRTYYKAFFDTRSELLEAFPDVSIQKIDDAIMNSRSFQDYMNDWKETLEVVNKREVSKVV